MLSRQRWLLFGAIGLYAAGVAATLYVLRSIAGHYTPFDSPELIFLHDRLAGHNRDGEMLVTALGLWTVGYLAIVVWAVRAGVEVTRKQLLWLLLAQGVVMGLLAALPIALDSDQFAYVGYAYASETGNPYEPAPISNATPVQAREVGRHWGNPLPTDRYGPAWTALNALLLRPFGGASLSVQTGVLRIAAIIAALAITVLLSNAFEAGTVFAVPLAFALNPLVALEAGNGAHNDVFVALGGVAAVILALRGRLGFAGVTLGIATAIKFAYAPFIAPLAAYAYATRRRLSDAVIALGGFVFIIAIASVPYGTRQSLVNAPSASFEHNSGVLLLLGRIATRIPGIGKHAGVAVDTAVLVIFLLCIAVLTFELLRYRFAPGFAVVTALVLLCLSGKIEPWYAMMATPLVLAGRPGFCAFAGITCGASVLIVSTLTGSFPIVPAFAAGSVAALLIYAAAPFGIPNVFKARTFG